MAADRRPGAIRGARRRHRGNFEGSYRLGGGRDFVIEGDEYDSAFFDKTAKFLKYLPDIAVVGNLEYDHADIYADIEAVRLAFRRLLDARAAQRPLLLGADSPEAARAGRRRRRSPVETFGLDDRRPTGGRRLSSRPAGRVRFDVWRHGEPFGTFELPLLGEHNVRNALAAIAVGHAVGLDADEMRARAARVPRRAPPARAARHGRRRDGVRRLRASSDGDCRDAAGRALVVAGAARLGGLRAPLGDVVPPRFPAGFRARVRRVRRRRDRDRGGLPSEPARRRAAVGVDELVRDLGAGGPAGARGADASTTSSRPSPPRRGDGRPRRRHVERRLRRDPRQAAEALQARVTGADAFARRCPTHCRDRPLACGGAARRR